ncbi:PilM protein [Pseudoduganella flava]|uniref:PilM protein n=1 Tax=Pseudoduganella flava TaxID=871742 RepID=A0A562PE19_9BURK|nr:type IV pilus biogenesis protein PilM [Pseudoduganella flava]QGZ42152.1 type IV pilus biogenesis protein PilM [Pseudoduganella flava]TWI42470.1 PilM protein [Pseudoduganella flava]
MWGIALMAVLLALGSAWAHQAQRGETAGRQQAAAITAEEMAVYRAAVARYFGVHDAERDTSVATATLRAEGMLRDWSTLPADRWANYRAADGTIYIYAAARPERDLGTAVATLAQGSLLAGVYRAGAATLYSPVHGDTGVPLAPLLARRAVPADSPVWLAAAQ